ncbi:MAG: type II toxin-antitoxin system PemK/MazF family toxin [Desulfobulbaceae bacterium]
MPISRGDIYLAALDPALGNEISKTRPVLVVSNNINNRYAGTVTVLPITSRKLNKMYPFELLLPKGTGNLPKDSKVKADQIRTLDKTRLVKHIGKLKNEYMNLLNEAIKIHLAL